MSNDRRPDQAIPVGVILEVQASLERDLFNAHTIEQMSWVCVHAVLFIYGLCDGMHG
jgi:hypothetical protein